MKKQLLDVLFASEKRKNVLLLLKDGSREMNAILKTLDTTRTALLPQIRILEEYHLINHDDDVYELSTIGKHVVEKMFPLLDTIEVFGTDSDYWRTHNLNFMPPHLLSRISEIGKPHVMCISPTEQYDVRSLYHEKNIECKFLCVVTTLLYPNYYNVFSDLIENDVKISLIVSEDLLEKICTHYRSDFEYYMKTDLVDIYVYNKKMDFLFFTYDDFYIILNLLRNDGEFDSRFIRSDNRDALKWGADFFDHYLKNSTRIVDI